jgi:uncharacterized damage-inducible protein DinB
MVTPELIRTLFEFNQWANRRTLDSCAALTSEQFTRTLGSSFGSVRDTLVHIYGAEWIWNERFQGRTPAGLPQAEQLPDLASVRSKLEEMDQYFLDYVSHLTQQDLDRVVHYKTAGGKEFSNPLWQSLQHLTNHGTYHRGQVVTMLRQLGSKPVSTDMIGFYREQAAAAVRA